MSVQHSICQYTSDPSAERPFISTSRQDALLDWMLGRPCRSAISLSILPGELEIKVLHSLVVWPGFDVVTDLVEWTTVSRACVHQGCVVGFVVDLVEISLLMNKKGWAGHSPGHVRCLAHLSSLGCGGELCGRHGSSYQIQSLCSSLPSHYEHV